jgi:serine/threonine protein kinase
MGWRDTYQQNETIETGSIGNVHLVKHRLTSEHFAVKELKYQHLMDEDVYYRFTHEIEIMQGLNHRNVVPIVEASLAASPPYYVMPRYESSLKDIVLAKGDQAHSIKGVIRPIIEATKYLHASNLAHRDLHPGNILFDGATFLIADFSLGKFIGVDSFHSQFGLGGVQGYAAPEQFAQNRDVNQLADIFALGGLLIFATTGRHPYEVSLDAIPFEYRAIVEKCRETVPARRFQTVQEFEQALNRIWDQHWSWEIRERIRKECESASPIIDPEAAIYDLLGCANDEWHTVVKYLLAIQNEDLLKLVVLNDFQRLLTVLFNKACRPMTPFRHLDPFGALLVRVAFVAPSCDLIASCAIYSAQIGHQYNRYSFRKFFREISDAAGRFEKCSHQIEAALLSLPDETRWLFESRPKSNSSPSGRQSH